MILADELDNYNAVILQLTVHVGTYFIDYDRPAGKGWHNAYQSGIVIIESIGESHFHSAIARFGLLIVILFGLAN